MPFQFFCEMTLTACLTVWSPGPNNIMLLSTASKYGIRKNMKFMAGIWTGSLSLMILCGLLCRTLSDLIPGIAPVMKCVGALYLLYLAYQTFRRLPPGEKDSDQEPSYVSGIVLQLVNVKIIIYGLTMFSSFILPYVSVPMALLGFSVYLMVLGAIGNLIWAFAGNVLKQFYGRHYKFMNLVMALLLVWCAARVIGIL